MLDSSKRKNYSDTNVATVIGPGTAVTGEINTKGTIRVEGLVSGRIQSDDTIVVQETGQVKADLTANQIIISGQVEGNVFAHERLEIFAKGRVIGDITTPRISIAEGVIFEGKCSMKSPVPSKSSPKPPVSSPDLKPSEI